MESVKCDRNYIASVLRDDFLENWQPPKMGMRREEIDRRSYERSAFRNILVIILTSEETPLAALEIFKADMEQRMEKHKMFEVTYDMCVWAEDIINSIM